MSLLEKIQNLPLRTRKIIFWLVLIVLAAALIFWRFSSFQKSLNDFQMNRFIEKLNLPDLKEIKNNAQKEINQ